LFVKRPNKSGTVFTRRNNTGTNSSLLLAVQYVPPEFQLRPGQKKNSFAVVFGLLVCIDTACPSVSLFLLVILYLALSSFFDKQMMPKQFVVAGVRDDDEQLGGVVILDIRFFFRFLPSGRQS
jgi:hypothetical protein